MGSGQVVDQFWASELLWGDETVMCQELDLDPGNWSPRLVISSVSSQLSLCEPWFSNQ